MNEDTEFPFTSEQVGEAQVVAAHPTENVLCYGTGTGEVECYTWDAPPHAGSETFETWPGWSEQFEPEESGQDDVRAVAYTAGGDHVVCVNASGSLMVIDSREGQQLYLAPQEAGSFHSLACIDASTFATGDDEGVIQVWDKRCGSSSCWESRHSLTEQSDYISCIEIKQQEHSLVATSGDGTLAVYDVRNGALKQLSDADEDELLSCVIVKRGRKVVAGSQDGVLSIFSWGHFEGCSDRFPGHPDTIDSILKYDEDTVITGGGDGGIRLVSIHPNKLLGVVGYIEDSYHGGGITDMALSSNQRLLVTVSDVAGDVRLWDLKTLQEDDDDDEGEEKEGDDEGDDVDSDDEPASKKNKASYKKRTKMAKPSKLKKTKKGGGNPSFFSGLA